MTSRLDEIKARAEVASSSPWVAVHEGKPGERGHSVRANSGMVIVSPAYGPDGGGAWWDAEFIAHARTDVPVLAAAVEAVLELHRPKRYAASGPITGFPIYESFCMHCRTHWGSEIPYPCPTVTTIHQALAVAPSE